MQNMHHSFVNRLINVIKFGFTFFSAVCQHIIASCLIILTFVLLSYVFEEDKPELDKSEINVVNSSIHVYKNKNKQKQDLSVCLSVLLYVSLRFDASLIGVYV